MLTLSLDRDTVRAVVALANRAPSVHNSQPWRWRLGRSSIHLFADRTRSLPATDPEGRDLLLSCGAALHHLRVALLASGVRAEVHRLPDPGHPEHLAAVEVHAAEPTPDDLSLARAIEHRHTDRRVFSTWPVPAPFLDDLVTAAAAEGAQLHVLAAGSETRAVVELVERAAVEQALTPHYTQETAEWTGRTRGAEDGVPAANVPARAEGTVPMRHFAAGTQEQNALGRGESDGTVLAVLTTEGDGVVDQLRAGEALSAVLLEATRLGLATDPITQPLEVGSTRARMGALISDDAPQPQVLLRIGWAPMSATPVARTGRRPVDDTLASMGHPWD